MSRKFVLEMFAAILVFAWGGSAFAFITTGDPSLPPVDHGVYLHPGNVHVLYSGAALDVILERPEHKAILVDLKDKLPQPGPTGEREIFISSLNGGAQACPPGTGPGGCGPSAQLTMNGPVETHVFGKDLLDTTGSWDTEMVSMSLSGNVGPIPVMIRESPTRQSLGHTSVTDVGGGLYRIDSFFDVFTDLSLDGGMNWIESAGSTRMVLVPEPATLSLFGLGMLGMLGRVRRRA